MQNAILIHRYIINSCFIQLTWTWPCTVTCCMYLCMCEGSASNEDPQLVLLSTLCYQVESSCCALSLWSLLTKSLPFFLFPTCPAAHSNPCLSVLGIQLFRFSMWVIAFSICFAMAHSFSLPWHLLVICYCKEFLYVKYSSTDKHHIFYPFHFGHWSCFIFLAIVNSSAWVVDIYIFFKLLN